MQYCSHVEIEPMENSSQGKSKAIQAISGHKSLCVVYFCCNRATIGYEI